MTSDGAAGGGWPENGAAGGGTIGGGAAEGRGASDGGLAEANALAFAPPDEEEAASVKPRAFFVSEGRPAFDISSAAPESASTGRASTSRPRVSRVAATPLPNPGAFSRAKSVRAVFAAGDPPTSFLRSEED